MSEEFCDGVKILLKRMESNPEEFRDTDRWEEFTNRHQLSDGFWSHALTPAELDALRDGMRKIYREVFTNRVMAKLLEDKEEQPILTAKSGWVDPRGVFISTGGSGGRGYTVGQGLKVDSNGAIYNPAQNSITATNNTSLHPLPTNPYQNSIQPGSWQTVASTGTSYASITQDAKKLGLGEMLKQKLAKL